MRMPGIFDYIRSLGYSIKRDGLCFGLACTAIQSSLKGKFHLYLEQLRYIEQLYEQLCLEQLSIQPLDELAGPSATLRASNERDRDLLAFLDAILLYQSRAAIDLTTNYKKSMKNNFGAFYHNRQDSAQGNSILNGNQPGIYLAKKSLKIFQNSEKLKGFLESSREEQEPFAVMISMHDHAIAVTFTDGQWHFSNHGLVRSTLTLTDEFILDIYSQIPRGVASIDEYTLNPSGAIIYSCDHISINHSSVDEQITLKLFMRMAYQNGPTEAVRIYCDSISQSEDLQPHEKEKLLLAIGADGRPAVSLAFQEGHTEAVRLYYDSILRLEIQAEKKAELLLAIGTDRNPAVRMAFQEGHTEAVRLYYDSILRLEIQAEKKADLLLAIDSHDNRSVIIAYHNGHAAAVRVYCESILQSGLKADKKAELLLAKGADGIPAVREAYQNGHTEAVIAYCNSILQLELDDSQKACLLLAIGDTKSPAVWTAICGGHTEAITVYCDSILQLELNANMKKKLLMASGGETNPAVAIALLKVDDALPDGMQSVEMFPGAEAGEHKEGQIEEGKGAEEAEEETDSVDMVLQIFSTPVERQDGRNTVEEFKIGEDGERVYGNEQRC